MASDERGPKAIEADIEVTRARLAANLDELLYRAKPSTIAQRETNKIKALFVDAEGDLRQDTMIKVVGGVLGFLALAAILRRRGK